MKSTNTSFLKFVISDKYNKRLSTIALALALIQFIIFKLLYPFPDFFSDSYSYLYAAQANLDVSIWPIGYSKFLRLFHALSHSDTALIAFQYFLLELSAACFFFTILYFYHPSKLNRIILFFFLFCNPLFLYLSNYVNSDPLFAALSLLWFANLLWVIHSPKRYLIITQAILLFFCFTVRNNAYYYPLIAIVAFLLSNFNWKLKATGIVLPFLFIIPFVLYTREAAYKMTGARQFSLFTGWQLANNALYAWEFMDSATNLPSQCIELDKMTRRFYSHVSSTFHRHISDYVGNFFIRRPYSPLKLYMDKHYKVSDNYNYIIAWGKSSAVFADYGSHLIEHNPGAYFWEFVLPNSKNYFLPPLEKLEIYNEGNDYIDLITMKWFHFRSTDVSSISKSAQGKILYVFPILFMVMNLFILATLTVSWFQNKHLAVTPSSKRFLIIASVFLLANFGFCLCATVVVLRYQISPMVVCLTFSLLLTQWLDKKAPMSLQRTGILESRQESAPQVKLFHS
jgi:hypothetical protein